MTNDPVPPFAPLIPESYAPLTAPQIEQIKTCIEHGIDLADLRKRVRAAYPLATSVELRTNIEYDDGSSYYWQCDEVAIFDEGGEIRTSTPGEALAYQQACKDIRRAISFGGLADPEDDSSGVITLSLDTPTLSELYSRT